MHKNESEHPFGDIGQLTLLGLFLVVWAGDSFFLRASTFLSDLVSPCPRLVLAAGALAVAAVFASSGHRVVDPEVRKAGLVTTGAFHYVRHPLYLASILFYLSLAAATASLLSLALAAGIAFFYNHLASYEERELESEYGAKYSEYRQRTGKWLPAIGGRAGPGRNLI